MTEQILKVILIAKREDVYSLYVFRDLCNNELMMCTKLPNWIIPYIEIGDVGYAKIQKVIAGEKYFDVSNEIEATYKYSNIYLLNYVKESDVINSNIII